MTLCGSIPTRALAFLSQESLVFCLPDAFWDLGFWIVEDKDLFSVEEESKASPESQVKNAFPKETLGNSFDDRVSRGETPQRVNLIRDEDCGKVKWLFLSFFP